MIDTERVYRIPVPNGGGQVRLVPEHAILSVAKGLQMVRSARSEQPQPIQAKAGTEARRP
jgi:hypothetical protein